MRLVFVLLLLGLCTGMAIAAPDGVDEKPWNYPDGYFSNRSTYPEAEPNDTCTTAQAFACGDLINPAQMNIVGDQDYYSFTANAGDPITIAMNEIPGYAGFDSYLELYNADCTTQLTYDDDGGPGLWSLISNFPAPYTGTYKILARSYGNYYTGYYQLSLTCGGGQQDPCDTCALAQQNGCVIQRCTTGTVQGTTLDDLAHYSPTNGCTGYSQAAGPDEVFIMDLNAGDSCDFIYTPSGYDAAFYILTDCANMNSCVIGADDPETIYNWTVPSTGRYYLVLDGYCSTCAGPFTLDWTIRCPEPQACCFPDGSCQMLMAPDCTAQGGTPQGAGSDCDPNPCTIVASEGATWGQIKSSYR